MTPRGLTRRLKAGLLVIVAVLSAWFCIGFSAVPGLSAEPAVIEEAASATILEADEVRLVDQPFYSELESWRERWDSGFLGQVVDTNPRLSLIKF